MANPNQKPADQKKFNLGDWLPEDFGKSDEFRSVEGLVPSYVPELAHAEGWDPVVGRLDRMVVLPTLFEGTKNEYTPLAFQIILSKANKAVTGKKGESRRIVEVKPGEPILIFISGNLQTKRDLLQAAVNESEVFPVVFRVDGKMKVNEMPSDMWVWQTWLGTRSIKRDGLYRLFPHDISLKELPAILKGELTEVPDRNAQPQAAPAS